MSASLLLTSFFSTAAEFWVLICGAIACVFVLYAIYRGRRGETAKAVPVFSASFAAGAFGRDVALRMTPNQQALASLFIIAFGIGFMYIPLPYAGAGIILWGCVLVLVRLLELFVHGYTRKLVWSQNIFGALFFFGLLLIAMDFVPLILEQDKF